MTRKWFIFLTVVLSLLVIPMLACFQTPLPSEAASAEVFKWRLQSVGPRGSIETNAVKRFADQVKKASNGRLDIAVYGADEIVPSFETFDAVSNGLLEMHCNDPSYWVGKTNQCSGITAIPFIFKSALDEKVFMENHGGLKVLRDVYAKHNIYLVNMFRAGDGTIWTKFKFSKISDFKGKKIRAHGMWAEALKRVGISAVTMPGGEVYEGMSRGVIDGLISANVAWCFDYGFHEVSKYVFSSESINICHLEFAVNMDAWKKLPDDLKEILSVCAKEAEMEVIAQNQYWDTQKLNTAMSKWKVMKQTLDEDSKLKLKNAMLGAVETFAKADTNFAKLANLLKEHMKVMGTK